MKNSFFKILKKRNKLNKTKIDCKNLNYSNYSIGINKIKNDYKKNYKTIHSYSKSLDIINSFKEKEISQRKISYNDLKKFKSYFPELKKIKNNKQLYTLNNLKDYYNEYLQIYNNKEKLIEKLKIKFKDYKIGQNFEIQLDTKEEIIINLINDFDNIENILYVKITFDIVNCNIFEAYFSNSNKIPTKEMNDYYLKNKSVINIKLIENNNIYIKIRSFEIFGCNINTKCINKVKNKIKKPKTKNIDLYKKIKNSIKFENIWIKKIKAKKNINKFKLKVKIKNNFNEKFKTIKEKKQKLFIEKIKNKKFKTNKYLVRLNLKKIAINFLKNKDKENNFLKNWIKIICTIQACNNIMKYLYNLKEIFKSNKNYIIILYYFIYNYKKKNLKKGINIDNRIKLEIFSSLRLIKLTNYKSKCKNIVIDMIKNYRMRIILLKKFIFLNFSIKKSINKFSTNLKEFKEFRKKIKKEFTIIFEKIIKNQFSNKIALKLEFFEFVYEEYIKYLKRDLTKTYKLLINKNIGFDKYLLLNNKLIISNIKIDKLNIQIFILSHLEEFMEKNKVFFRSINQLN